MHYGVHPSALALDDQLPMSGLVEALLPTTNVNDLFADLHRLLREIAALLGDWSLT